MKQFSTNDTSSRQVNQKIRFLYLAVILAAFAGWYLGFLNGSGVSAIAALLAGIYRLQENRSEQKQLGLNNEEYLLSKAGGANALYMQSGSLKTVAWILVIIPFLLGLFMFLAGKNSYEFAMLGFIIGSLFLLPLALFIFYKARKMKHVAEQTGAKFE
jgi:O-antigen/teichoic acid export membrane protein